MIADVHQQLGVERPHQGLQTEAQDRRAARRGRSASGSAALDDARATSASHLLHRGLAEHARGPEQQHEDEEREDVDVAQVGRESRRAPNSSIRPISMPPSMAPRTLPMPPTTAATNALSPSSTQVACAGWLRLGYLHRVEEPGRGGERRAEHERERDHAVDGDAHQRGDAWCRSDTARIARPSFVREDQPLERQHQRERQADHQRRRRSWTCTPATVTEDCRRAAAAACAAAACRRATCSWPTFCRNSDTPIAVMSTFRRGALRSGR